MQPEDLGSDVDVEPDPEHTLASLDNVAGDSRTVPSGCRRPDWSDPPGRFPTLSADYP